MLGRLSPNLILESPELEDEGRHKVHRWQDILDQQYLKRGCTIRQDSRNEGRLRICIAPAEGISGPYYPFLHESAVTDYRKEHR